MTAPAAAIQLDAVYAGIARRIVDVLQTAPGAFGTVRS
jgi:hypothetical protein